MRVAFGSDHAGWPLRERILAELRRERSRSSTAARRVLVPGDDYPDVAAAVGTRRRARQTPIVESSCAAAAWARASRRAS